MSNTNTSVSCDICHRSHHPTKLPFLCVVDARNCLYQSRIQHARSLIENEELQANITHILSPSDTSSSSHKAIQLETLRAQHESHRIRTQEIIALADKLRHEVSAARKVIESRRKGLAKRKASLEAKVSSVAAVRSRQLEEEDGSIKMCRYLWKRDAESMATTRGFLCMEAARLYGLRRIKRGSSITYELGGVPVVDLSAMSVASPSAVSTSLAHIVHMVALASSYLAVRLPAEMTLPHRDYPRPTIFSLSSSHQHGDIRYPGNGVVLPDQNTDLDHHHVPRPRPLVLEKPLPVMAKEDPARYSRFIEGVVLLAYNVAWLCCTQGVSIGNKNSNEDTYNIGRNLYNLLMGTQLFNSPSNQLMQSALHDETRQPEESPTNDLKSNVNLVGRYSHGTVYNHLGGATGNELIRHFNLPSPVKVADRLKQQLLNEASTLDWDLLEGERWTADGKEAVPDHVSDTDPNFDYLGVQSIMSTRTITPGSTRGNAAAASNDHSQAMAKPRSGGGNSGWTRVKSRA